MDMDNRRRRGKRDRALTLVGERKEAATASSLQAARDPDYELIHAFRLPIQEHRSPLELLQEDHLAFSSIDPLQYQDKTQCAGVSSAAACIVFELPTMTKPPPRSTRSRSSNQQYRQQPSVDLLSNNNRKRRSPVSTEEITKWRNASTKTCYRFKPVYTHQFFTDERIQGFRPTDGAMEEARSVSGGALNMNRPSFSQHGIADHTLSIQVRLAPSCRKCCLILEVRKAVEPLNDDVKSTDKRLVLGPQAKSRNRSQTTTDATCFELPRKVSISSLSESVSCDGDDEDDGGEFQLRNVQGRKRTRRDGVQRRSSRQKKEQGRTTPEPHEINTRRSKRTHSQHQNNWELSAIGESEAATGESCHVEGLGGQPRQSKRLMPMQVTDVSENETSCHSSDDETAALQDDTSIVEPHSGLRKRASSSISISSAPDLGKMKVGTIITQVTAGLPEVAAVLLSDENAVDGSFKVLSSNVDSIADIENDYLDQPMGAIIREYSREKTNMRLSGSGGISSTSRQKGGSRQKLSDGDFVLALADMRTDNEARRHHDEIEKISQWYIEIASCVEVGMNGGVEADGGYWKVLYLFEKHHHRGGATKYSLAGYVTLLYHTNGLKMTVCQAVCLPPYQRSGHGTEMLMTAYDVCEGREILVESPAPAFVALRNRIDYSLVSSLIERTKISAQGFAQPTDLFNIKDTSLPDNILAKVGSELHITPSQVATAFEIWKLGQLEKSIQAVIQDTLSSSMPGTAAEMSQTIASMEATYKSVVKRRLLDTLRRNQENKWYFCSLGSAEQGDHLEKCFNATIVHYRYIRK